MPKLKSNTFKNTNYHFFRINVKIDVQNEQNNKFSCFPKKTPKSKTNACEFRFILFKKDEKNAKSEV